MLKEITQVIIRSRKTSYIMRHGLDDYLYARLKYGKDWYDQTNYYSHYVLENFSDIKLEKYKEYIKLCLKRSKLKELQDILIRIIDSNCENFEESYSLAVLLVKNANAGGLRPADWSALESFVLSQGFFVLGLECHKKYCYSVFLQRNRFFRGFSRFAVLLEQGKGKEASKELEQLEKSKVLRKLRNRTLYIARLYCNALNQVKEKPIPPFTEDRVTSEYHSYVKGKKLLLLGPAPTDSSDNDYDIILRINDAENNHQGDGLMGKRTDISYFNVERVDKEITAGENFSKIKFAVWKNRFGKIEKNYTNVRGTICPSDILTIGHFNMIQIALSDLLRFEWNELKIIGTNLMAGKKLYADDYIRSKEKNDVENFLDAYSTHNAFCQFYFMQNMYKAGVFRTDDELHSILTHTAEEYSERMERIHLTAFRHIKNDIYKEMA